MSDRKNIQELLAQKTSDELLTLQNDLREMKGKLSGSRFNDRTAAHFRGDETRFDRADAFHSRVLNVRHLLIDAGLLTGQNMDVSQSDIDSASRSGTVMVEISPGLSAAFQMHHENLIAAVTEAIHAQQQLRPEPNPLPANKPHFPSDAMTIATVAAPAVQARPVTEPQAILPPAAAQKQVDLRFIPAQASSWLLRQNAVYLPVNEEHADFTVQQLANAGVAAECVRSGNRIVVAVRGQTNLDKLQEITGQPAMEHQLGHALWFLSQYVNKWELKTRQVAGHAAPVPCLTLDASVANDRQFGYIRSTLEGFGYNPNSFPSDREICIPQGAQPLFDMMREFLNKTRDIPLNLSSVRQQTVAEMPVNQLTPSIASTLSDAVKKFWGQGR